MARRDTRKGANSPEREMIERLRAREESAFEELIDAHGATMLRVAGLYVRDREAAHEVVQETWLAVLNGIDEFEERSSLRTWIFRILANRARTRGEREGRSLPFSAVATSEAKAGEPAVDPERFLGAGSATPGAWAAPPPAWPDDRLLQRETVAVIGDAIDLLPEAQQAVIRLRDLEGWSAREISDLLEISDGNQRVLLHRARSKVRSAVERYLNPEMEARS